MKYIYGPVKSRRLGFSLGVSLTPYKVCSFDCVYCQLGKTTQLDVERKDYLPLREILDELKFWLANNPQDSQSMQFITISGSGEPTLSSDIKELLGEVKKITSIPVAVITNASLLSDPEVRGSILQADLIVPSLDAVVPKVFEKINRPHPSVSIDKIIQGLIQLRKEFRGKIWLEVMLVKGINEDLRYIKKLKESIDEINPDKIQLNSPVRSTTEEGILPVDKAKLRKIQSILGDNCEIFD